MSKAKKPRESGHYWVMWSGVTRSHTWRIGAYWADVDGWKLTGDTRLYRDSDFLDINEVRVPFPYLYWQYGPALFWFALILLAWNVTWYVFDIYTLITAIKK